MQTETIGNALAPIEHPAIEKLKQALGEIELDVTTNYTLADAIREGAAVTPQAIGSWGQQGEACALSAAYLAAKARGWTE